MAFSATTHWDCQTGGSDSNGGGFDPGNANMATDLTVVSGGNTAAPVVSSASYNFVSGDAGAYLFVQSGTNLQAGWYPITSCASNQATLDATAGHVTLWSSPYTNGMSAANGITTNGSSSTGAVGTWSIDYSRGTSARTAYTDLVIDGTTNTKVTSSANPFGNNVVGNVINVTSGTGFTVQRVQVVSVTGTAATVDKSLGTLSSTGGNGNLGGCLASPGQAGAVHVAGNAIWAKTGTYSITSASTNVSGGCPSLTAGTATNDTRLVGYGTYHGDGGTRPLLQASGISSFTVVSAANHSYVENVAVDCQSYSSSKGIQCNNGGTAYRCKASNATGGGMISTGSNAQFWLCEATGCSSFQAFNGCEGYGCAAYGNSVSGFGGGIWTDCVSFGNTGASGYGFFPSGNTILCHRCLAYNNAQDGFRTNSTGNIAMVFSSCLSVGNGGAGFKAASACDVVRVWSCAGYNNTSGNTANITAGNILNFQTLTQDPFVNAAANNFALNWSAGGGMLCRAAGLVGVLPGTNTTGYTDIGAAQHKDDGSLLALAQPAASADGVSVSSLTVNFGTATTAGNTIVVAVFRHDPTKIPSISGFTLAGSDTTYSGVWAFYQQHASSVSSVTVTTNGSADRISAVAFEISGLPTSGTIVDQTVTGHVAQGAGTTATTSAYTTTTPQQVLLAFWVGDDAANSPSDLVVPATTTHYYPVVAENGTTAGPSYAAGIKVVDAIQTGVTATIGVYAANSVNVGYVVLTLSATAIGGGGGSSGGPVTPCVVGANWAVIE